jgi:hypothetical protein
MCHTIESKQLNDLQRLLRVSFIKLCLVFMILCKCKLKRFFNFRLSFSLLLSRQVNFYFRPWTISLAFCLQFCLINCVIAQQSKIWPTEIANLNEFRNIGSSEDWVSLGTNFPVGEGGAPISSVYDIDEWPKAPEKGKILYYGKSGNLHRVRFQKYPFAEGIDSFIWTAQDNFLRDRNFTAQINITPTLDPLILFADQAMYGDDNSIELSVIEEKNLITTVTLWDPDPELRDYSAESNSSWPQLYIQVEPGDDDRFKLVRTSVKPEKVNNSPDMNGWKQTYELRWKSSAPNFEEIDKTQFNMTLKGEDLKDTQFGVQSWDFRINLEDKPEAPIPVSIEPRNDPLFQSFATSVRKFPADSEFLKTKDASYVIKEDSGATIIVPFTILAPDLDEYSSFKDFRVWFEAERPFNIENNSSWVDVEEVSLQFVKPARFRVTDVDPTSGAINEMEIIYPGFGYNKSSSPVLLHNESNTSGIGASITIDPINGEYQGMLLSSSNYMFNNNGSGYAVDDNLTAALPDGVGFEKLYEGEANASKLYPSLSEGTIKIRYLSDDVFTPLTQYKFFAKDEDDSVQTDLVTKSEYPFFVASVEIVNDYTDDILLNLNWPKSQNDGQNIPHNRDFPENSTQLIADFDITDPDSWPTEELRIDNNKTNVEGARILYDLEWVDPSDISSFTQGAPSDYFAISPDGMLRFINPPDYDTLYPQNTFRLKVQVEDALSIESNLHKRTSSYQLLNIIIDREDEPNVFINSRYEPSDPPTYSIELLEDGVWEWRKSSYDLNGTQMRLVAKDLDYENEDDPEKDDYRQPEWSVLMEPLKGEVFLSSDIEDADYDPKGKRWSVPTYLRYEASPNKIGIDEFSLDFGGLSPVQFKINIINQPDKPVLKEIYTISGLGEEKPLDFNETSNVHYLFFNEDELPYYRLTFADEEDNDAIARLEVKAGAGDEELFDITEMQIGADGFAFIEISLKELADFDQPSDDDFNNDYEITVVVEDNSSKSPPNNYKFVLLNQGIDEGAKITLPDLFTDEEQKIAAKGIYAEDPEGEDKNFTWSIKAGEGNWTFFELNATQGNSVDLLFRDNKIPSYETEAERELNATLLVNDGRQTTSKSFTISLVPRNDPPFFALTEAEVVEPSLIAIADLNDLITDEDGDFLTFFINPDVPEENDLKYFESELSQGKTLLFKNPSDYEEKSKYTISIVAEDSYQGRTEGNITILVRNRLEPPQVRWTGDEDQDFSLDDPIVTSMHFQDLKEDEPYEIRELFFYDPEESVPSPENLTFEIVSDYEGNFTVLESPTSEGSKPNGRFLYIPPPDGYTYAINPQNGERVIYQDPYSVEIKATDKDNDETIFTFQFSVEDYPDPPAILLNTEIDNNIYSTIDPTDQSIIRNNEGSENVVILVADDSKDSTPSLNYEWLQPYGPDGHLFKLIPLIENQKEVLLKWNLDMIGGRPPDWANPPARNPGLPAPPFYEVKVRLFGNPADLNETGDNTVEKTLRIKLIDLANQPPQFMETSLPPYKEGSTDLFAGRVNAYDPDEASLEILNEPRFQIHYELQESGAYPDYIWFDKQIFDKDDSSPADYIGGQLVFKVAPDYEYFLNQGVGTTLEVLVRAREFGVDGYNDQETYQVIKIPLENRVEQPFFSSIDTDLIDANFSLIEESDDTFRIFAETPDHDKNLTISISGNLGFDNHLFTIKPLDPVDSDIIESELSFLVPPDRESPRDFNKDNIYEVELNITTSDPTVWKLDLIKIQVDDLDYPYEISQDQIIRVHENEAFVVDIDVLDPENLQYYPDLLISNEGGAFYLSNSYAESPEKAQFSSQTIFPIGDQDITAFSLSADFDNDGSADVLCISESGAKIFYNKGYGTFPRQSFLDFSEYTDTISLPKHAVVEDFDQDGDEDVVLSYFSFNGLGPAEVYYFENKINQGDHFGMGKLLGSGWMEPSYLLAIDIDRDYNLDLVVADSAKDEVFWFVNDGEADFTFGGIIAGKEDGLVKPKCLESLDLDSVTQSFSNDNYSKPDLLIGARGKIYVAENNGLGEFEVYSILDNSIQGNVENVRAIRLDDDSKPDLVFTEKGKDNAFFSLGYNSYFDVQPVITPKLNLSISHPSSLEVHNFVNEDGKSQSLVLLGATPAASSIPKVYQFGPPSRTDESSSWEFVNFHELTFPVGEIKGNLQSLVVADLDRSYNTYQFAIEDNLNFEEFDRLRVKANGRLFFNQDSIPDYENPLPGSENLYRLYITYSKNGSDSLINPARKELFQIEVIDVNEPPVILDFNGSLAGIYQHPENIQSLGVVPVDNPESQSDVLEGIEYYIVPGKDANFFDLNKTTGELLFKKAPDREKPKDKGVFIESDHVYEVEVRVKEQSIDEYEDQKLFRIEVIDGPENPFFDPNSQKFGTNDPPGAVFGTRKSVSTSVAEDFEGGLILLVEDLNLIDPNVGGSFTDISILADPTHGAAFFQIDGNETPLTDVLFSNPLTFETDIRKLNLIYIPDANYSGHDKFSIEATSIFGIPAQLEIEVFVEEQNDEPAFFETITDTIFRNEGVRNILTLKGVDEDVLDVGTLKFELIDSFDAKMFAIDQNVLKFANPFGLDYEVQSRFQFEIKLSSGSTNNRYKEVIKTIDLRVINLADEPPISVALEEATKIQVYEGQRSLLDLVLRDPDEFSPVQAYLLDEFDADLFTLTQLGELLTVSPGGLLYYPDDPAKNFYEVTLVLEDADMNNTYHVSIEVLDMDENPPFLITGNSPALHQVSVFENSRFVYEIMAQDIEVESNLLQYSIQPGLDATFFELNQENNFSAILSFKEIPDFESPFDGLFDNGQYQVVLGVSDGVNLVEQLVTVTVQDANDLPVLVTSNFNLNEDTQNFIGSIEVFDEDDDPVIISLAESPLFGSVSLLGNQISYIPEADFYGIDTVVVSLDDGNAVNLPQLSFTVSSVNDPPVAVDDSRYFYQDNPSTAPSFQINVLENDHTGPDNSFEKSSYRVDGNFNSSASHGSVYLTSATKGIFTYRPNSNFTGADSFQYRLINDGLADTATVHVWVATSAGLPDWTNLKYFGAFYKNNDSRYANWIYHADMGWVYVHQPDQLLEASWIWQEIIGWFWTGDRYFKWVYHDKLKQWLYWRGGINSAGGWFLSSQSGNRYYERDFILMQVRDDVIEILPNLEDLSRYIHYSDFFSSSDKKTIITELALRRNSPTLNKILQFDFSY